MSAYYVPSTISAILQMRKVRAGKGSGLSKVTRLANGRDGTQTESVWLLSPCPCPTHKAALD